MEIRAWDARTLSKTFWGNENELSMTGTSFKFIFPLEDKLACGSETKAQFD